MLYFFFFLGVTSFLFSKNSMTNKNLFYYESLLKLQLFKSVPCKNAKYDICQILYFFGKFLFFSSCILYFFELKMSLYEKKKKKIENLFDFNLKILQGTLLRQDICFKTSKINNLNLYFNLSINRVSWPWYCFIYFSNLLPKFKVIGSWYTNSNNKSNWSCNNFTIQLLFLHWIKVIEYIMNMWFMDMNVSSMQILMIMVAAMTKSAQMPFSSWLPAAMAAPTPVSALVHSSTLVTAGVFLLLRFYPFLHKLELFNSVLLYLAMMTMIMSGLCACVEWDMKKIIALSTLSQLGLMMTSLGLNMPYLTFFHMVVHAMFKALLFICAGILINNYMHSQDLRWMGNLIHYMPMTSSCSLVANLAMSGFPFMAAFYSKDSIIEMSIYIKQSTTVLGLLYISVGITSFYGVRFYINFMWQLHSTSILLSLNEPNNVTTPMLMLVPSIVCTGLIMWWVLPNWRIVINIDKPSMMMTPLIMSVGMFLSWVWNDQALDVEYPTLHMSSNMWYMVPVSTQMNKYFLLKSKTYLEDIDHSWYKYVGGYEVWDYMNLLYKQFLILIKYSPTSLLAKTSSIMSITVLVMLM
uniref:NADH-ubiquinone oxidoreductase chain 5 n=1 Tax=Erpobdella japonica TaxID=184739 RepID=A0A343KJP7_9ANNE|nr:NADH dehydrogenase subunit 5 [Erpobdella japonica]ATG87471.1 NADH dehydrogenase subunit 5 [Erpobdella japonica]